MIVKKMKRLNTAIRIVDTVLITSVLITGGISTAAFASVVGLPVGITLGIAGLVFPLLTCIT